MHLVYLHFVVLGILSVTDQGHFEGCRETLHIQVVLENVAHYTQIIGVVRQIHLLSFPLFLKLFELLGLWGLFQSSVVITATSPGRVEA